MSRPRLPSVPELEERLRKVEEVTGTGPHAAVSLSSTPPAIQWVQRKAVRYALRIAAAIAIGAATWWGGWLAKDCQDNVTPRSVPYPAPGSLK